MDGTNSRNVTFIAVMLIVIFIVFAYVLITHNVNDMIYTDIYEEVED